MVASYVKEECTLEAIIQLPPEYPLRNVEVSCTKRMGVSESRCAKVAVNDVLLTDRYIIHVRRRRRIRVVAPFQPCTFVDRAYQGICTISLFANHTCTMY